MSRAEGQALAGRYGLDFVETSAKTGLGVSELFAALVRRTPRLNRAYKVLWKLLNLNLLN